MRVLLIDSNEKLNHLMPYGFRALGHEVKVIGHVTQVSLSQTLSTFLPDLVITEGWGWEQIESRQIWIREAVQERRIPHVYWSVEDPAFTESFVRPLIQRMGPDYVFTICKDTVAPFRSEGIRAAHLDWGFSPHVHHLGKQKKRYRKNVVIVANAYGWILERSLIDYRFQCIKLLVVPLIEQGIRVDFWGNGWDSLPPRLGIRIPPRWCHGPIPYEQTRKIYHSAKIVIGLQNYETQVTQRTYEVLASGGFLLTADTPAVRALFQTGKDLVVSASPEDTVRLVNHYLHHRTSRRRIRRRGYHAVQKYRFRRRVKQMLRKLYREGVLVAK